MGMSLTLLLIRKEGESTYIVNNMNNIYVQITSNRPLCEDSYTWHIETIICLMHCT